MSAPLSGSSGGNPAPGFYPDPSIPGYIRYWNGSSWVPGTSRPEPQEGEELPTPPSAAAASAARTPPTREEPAPAEETGPVFLDEEGPRAEGGPQAQVPAARGESPLPESSFPDSAFPESSFPDSSFAGASLPEVRPRGEVATAGGPEAIDWDDPSRLHGRRPESASAWQADASQQTGFAGQREERVSWGRAESGEEGATSDPRGGWGRPGDETGTEGRTDASGTAPAAGTGQPGAEEPADPAGAVPREGTVQMRMTPEALRRAGAGQSTSGQSGSGQPGGEQSPDPAGAPPREGTVQMRAMTPEALRRAAREAGSAGAAGGQGAPAQPGADYGTQPGAQPGAQPGTRSTAQPGAPAGAAQPEHTVGLRRSDVLRAAPGTQTPPASPTSSAPPAAPASPSVPGQGAPGQQPQTPAQTPPAVPQQPQHQQQQPSTYHQPPQPPQPQQHQHQAAPAAGPGAPAQPSWAQQVHDLAGGTGGGAPGVPPGGPEAGAGAEAMIPWRPPTVDPFLQAAQQEARPAGPGKRLGARLVDGVLTAAVAVAAASPFAGQAADHVQAKIDAVRRAGETKTVWLIDGTTGGYLAVVLGAMLLFGLLYEVLPTQRWGRTLGKRLFGLRVLTMEQQDRPGFGGAFLRWLTYGVLALLVVGVVNVLWCVFDRPWRQCWHDKVAGTFVSKDSGEIRL